MSTLIRLKMAAISPVGINISINSSNKGGQMSAGGLLWEKIKGTNFKRWGLMLAFSIMLLSCEFYLT